MAISTNGTVLARVAGALYNTQMSNATYKEVASLDPSALVNVLYSRDFSTQTDASVATTIVKNLGLSSITGLNNWVAAQLTAAGSNKGAKVVELLNSFAQMTGDATYGAYATAFNAKVDNALALSQTADNAGGTFEAAGVIGGKTFTLTTGTDALNGTAGNDTFSGALVGAAAAGTTIQPGDNLTGGLGIDKFTVTVTGNAGASYTLAGVSTTGVETLEISNFDADTTADGTVVDAALMTGLSTVSLYASSADGDTKINTLQNIVAAEMRNGAGDLKIAYTAATVAGTADNQALTVSNLTGGTFTADGTETVSLKSELVKSTVTDIVSNKLKSLTVTGDKDLVLTNSIDFAATGGTATIDGTIDASAFTGKLDVTATTAQTVKVTGGSGDDTINLGATLTKYDVIDGGAGNDTLKISATANRTFADTQITNVETLEFGVDTNTLTDLDVKALADTVKVNLTAITTDKDVTVNNVGAGQVIAITNDSANTLELGDVAVNLEVDTNTNDSVSVSLVAKTDADQTLDLLTVDDAAESMSIAVSGATGTGKEYTLTSLIADGAKTISVTGSGNFITTLNQTGTNVTTTFDASAATGTLSFTEAVTNDMTIKGSAGANTFVMGSTLNNKDTLVGGASTKDSVSATVGSATTATTGALNLTAIETLALTSTDGQTAEVSLAASTGVTKVTVAASSTTGDGVLNLKGLAAGTVVATTDQATNDFDGTIAVTLADATGTADALTIELNNATSEDDVTITSTGVETLTIKATDTGLYAGTSVNVNGVDAASLIVTGGVAASALDMTKGTTKLNKAVTSVDASAFLGSVTFVASDDATASGVAVKAGELAVSSNAFVDDITATTATGKTDSLTATLGTSATSANFISKFKKFETYDLTFKDGVAITAAANEGLGDGDNIVTSITLKGGNTLSSYTAAGAIDGTKLTSFDASAFNGTTSINVDSAVASAVTLKAGASTTDSLTYSAVNGLAAATTGKLVSTGFETVKLLTATAASTIDASGLAGATTIAVENDQNVTLSKLAAGTTIQLGATAYDESNATTTDDYTGTLTVSLADETGTADTIKFSIVNTDGDNNVSAVLKTTAIETVEVSASTATGTNDVQLDVSGVKAATLKLSGGATGELVDLTKGTTTLSSSTGTVDSSSFSGSLTVSANANKATSLTTKTGAVTFVGSSAADTVTVGKAGAEITSDVGTSGLIDGGSGSDTLTAYVSTSASLRYVEAVETINLVAAATDADYTVTTFASSKGGNDASVVNVSGGQSGKVVTLGGDIADHAVTIDASASAGSVAMTWAAGALIQTNIADAISIKGGTGSKDAVSVSYALDTAENTGTFTMSGVETLNVASTFTTTQTAADVVDLTNVTGLTKVVLTTGATNPNSITVSKLTSATTVQLGLTPATGSEFQGVTAKLDLADATGTADSLNVSLFDTNAASSTATIQADGIETLSLTLADSTEDHKVALSNTNDNAATLNVTGVNTSADLTITSLADAYTTIAASGLKGKLTMADNSRTGTAAMTITSGTGADTLIQKNASDVIDAGTSGTGTDTLKVVANFVLGGIQVDLSSTTDQVTTFNSFANSAIQKGFENVDLSGITGTYGADVTARAAGSTIVGTGNIDNIIGGAGKDTITMGKASTTLAYDAINAGAGSDTLVIVGSVTTSTTEAQNIIDLSSTSDQVSKVNNANETTVQVGFENVDLSGLSVSSGGGFTITAAAGGSNIKGTADTDVIYGGVGVDVIDGGTDSAVDTIYIAASGTGVATAGSTSTSAATMDKITVELNDVVDVTGIVATDSKYDGFATLVTSGNIGLTVTAAGAGASSSTSLRVKGIYDAVTDTFTVDNTSSANAVMLLFAATDAGTTATDGIILIGVTDVQSMANGVITV